MLTVPPGSGRLTWTERCQKAFYDNAKYAPKGVCNGRAHPYWGNRTLCRTALDSAAGWLREVATDPEDQSDLWYLSDGGCIPASEELDGGRAKPTRAQCGIEGYALDEAGTRFPSLYFVPYGRSPRSRLYDNCFKSHWNKATTDGDRGCLRGLEAFSEALGCAGRSQVRVDPTNRTELPAYDQARRIHVTSVEDAENCSGASPIPIEDGRHQHIDWRWPGSKGAGAHACLAKGQDTPDAWPTTCCGQYHRLESSAELQSLSEAHFGKDSVKASVLPEYRVHARMRVVKGKCTGAEEPDGPSLAGETATPEVCAVAWFEAETAAPKPEIATRRTLSIILTGKDTDAIPEGLEATISVAGKEPRKDTPNAAAPVWRRTIELPTCSKYEWKGGDAVVRFEAGGDCGGLFGHAQKTLCYWEDKDDDKVPSSHDQCDDPEASPHAARLTEKAVRETSCDGIDEDCDGTIDDEFEKLGQPCRWSDDAKTRPCVSYVCREDGNGVVCPPVDAVEVCDGQDNDCDGQTDEEFAISEAEARVKSDVGVTYEEPACGVGPCEGGKFACLDQKTATCSSYYENWPDKTTKRPRTVTGCDFEDANCDGKSATSDAKEICDPDEVDENCNRLKNEGTIEAGKAEVDNGKAIHGDERPPDACGAGACAGGHVVCDSDGGWTCSTYGKASAEQPGDCIDNDCDGLVDEGADGVASDGTQCKCEWEVSPSAKCPWDDKKQEFILDFSPGRDDKDAPVDSRACAFESVQLVCPDIGPIPEIEADMGLDPTPPAAPGPKGCFELSVPAVTVTRLSKPAPEVTLRRAAVCGTLAEKGAKESERVREFEYTGALKALTARPNAAGVGTFGPATTKDDTGARVKRKDVRVTARFEQWLDFGVGGPETTRGGVRFSDSENSILKLQIQAKVGTFAPVWIVPSEDIDVSRLERRVAQLVDDEDIAPLEWFDCEETAIDPAARLPIPHGETLEICLRMAPLDWCPDWGFIRLCGGVNEDVPVWLNHVRVGEPVNGKSPYTYSVRPQSETTRVVVKRSWAAWWFWGPGIYYWILAALGLFASGQVYSSNNAVRPQGGPNWKKDLLIWFVLNVLVTGAIWGIAALVWIM